PATAATELDLLVVRDAEPAFLVGAVRPEDRVDGIRNQGRLHHVSLHRAEEAALGELSRKGGGPFLRRRLEGVDAAVVLAEVADEELSLAVRAEAGDGEPRVGDLALPEDLRAVVLDAPDLSRGVIAVKIRPDEFGKLLAVVDDAARQRTRLGMRVLDG